MTTVKEFSIGVDIGGTFTDCVIVDSEGQSVSSKVLTTTDDPSVGFFHAIDEAAAGLHLAGTSVYASALRIAHGTTAGINAVVTRQGARVGLLATRGHSDAIRIMDNSGRTTGATMEELLDYTRSTLPTAFVSPSDIYEISERIDSVGEVILPLNETDVREAVERLVADGVEALAVAYLWSHVNPRHEEATRRLIRDAHPDIFVTLSSEVAQRIGEYPRTATAVVNSYIGPLMKRYLGSVVDGARSRGYDGSVLFATSSGGSLDVATVALHPITTIQSGPASGVLACASTGRLRNDANILATDMGGTSLDVSIIEAGRILLQDETVVERHQLHLRKVDIESIGAGGGSIAWVDKPSGTIRVGPQSAGSTPGPICYGRGGLEPTVTDADLALGLLSSDKPLAGGLHLDRPAAEAGLRRLGSELGLELEQCAAGIIEIVDSLMEDLLRRVTLQKGHDPRDFSLWAYGGAAGMHATKYAKELGIGRVVVPLSGLASTWSAYGVAMSDLVRTFEWPCYVNTPVDHRVIETAFQRLEHQARDFMAEVHPGSEESVLIERNADVKYALQFYSVDVGIESASMTPKVVEELLTEFERLYESRYGIDTGYAEGGMTITALRVTARLPWRAQRATRDQALSRTPVDPIGARDVYWHEFKSFRLTPVFDGSALAPDQTVEGPAVLEYPGTTVIVRPSQHSVLNDLGDLVITQSFGEEQ